MTKNHCNQLFEDISDRMREHGMRVTKQRIEMISTLAESSSALSAEEIHQQLKVKSIDPVTVYRSMESLEKAGIVLRILTERGKSLFKLAHHDAHHSDQDHDHHHHHILCRNCHKTTCLDFCAVGELAKFVQKLGYADVTHVLELYGICPECQSKVSKKKAANN